MNFLYILFYSKRTGIRILRHVLFWLTDLVNYLLVISINREINLTQVLRILFVLPLIAAGTYFVMYYLIPRYSRNPNRGAVAFWIIAVLFYQGVVVRFYEYYILYPLVDPDLVVNYNIWEFRRIVAEIMSSMVVMCMAIAIKLIKTKVELEQHNDKLATEKKEAELNFLKLQMHPHFLFNTLNTLYSETIQESGKAQQVVLHLSNLLRFILEECNKPLIPIFYEIKVIEDFIALERLRHGNRLNVHWAVDNIEPKALISPLIFLPFVENSFKHSLSSKRGIINIEIELEMKDNRFMLIIRNDKEGVVRKLNGHYHGSGIANVRRQLDLLYGGDYSLVLDDQQHQYRVSLAVPAR